MNTNKIKIKDVSTGTSAIVAGIGLLIMAIIAPIANFSILEGLIKPENASEAFSDIVALGGQIRIAVLLNLMVAILDIIVAWALYIYLKPLNKSLSLLAAWFRIIYAVLYIAVLFYLLNILQLISGADYLPVMETNQLQSQIVLLLNKYFIGWDFTIIVFGLHLLLIGILMLKAGYMKKILGILIIIAALGYLIDGGGKVLSPDYNIEIALYTFVGEVVLIFWLLIRGWKIRENEEI